MEFVSRKKVVRITKKMSSYYEKKWFVIRTFFRDVFVTVRDDVRDHEQFLDFFFLENIRDHENHHEPSRTRHEDVTDRHEPSRI